LTGVHTVAKDSRITQSGLAHCKVRNAMTAACQVKQVKSGSFR